MSKETKKSNKKRPDFFKSFWTGLKYCASIPSENKNEIINTEVEQIANIARCTYRTVFAVIEAIIPVVEEGIQQWKKDGDKVEECMKKIRPNIDEQPQAQEG